MTQTAKLFTNGNSQAVRLPAAYRFDGKEVYIRQDPITGDVILSRRPKNWDNLIDAIKDLDADDFLSETDREQEIHDRDPFEGWTE